MHISFVCFLRMGTYVVKDIICCQCRSVWLKGFYHFKSIWLPQLVLGCKQPATLIDLLEDTPEIIYRFEARGRWRPHQKLLFLHAHSSQWFRKIWEKNHFYTNLEHSIHRRGGLWHQLSSLPQRVSYHSHPIVNGDPYALRNQWQPPTTTTNGNHQ